MRVNPDGYKENTLLNMSKGVKCIPISFIDPIFKGIDATHADINLGQFFKKIIVREIAQVTKWDLTQDIKCIVQDSESKFDKMLKLKLGMNHQLMMPGNYARTLFTTDHSILLSLICNDERKKKLSEIVCLFNELRTVYRCLNPLADIPDNVFNYKRTALKMAGILLQDFDYVSWPNYLHKIIEHVQELICHPDGVKSVGSLSSEGNEAGNKLFRLFRKNIARRGSTYGGLVDVLNYHWLYSSKVLGKLAEVEHRKNKCSLCHLNTHIRRNCPLSQK